MAYEALDALIREKRVSCMCDNDAEMVRALPVMMKNAMLGLAAKNGHPRCMTRLEGLGATDYSYAFVRAAVAGRLRCAILAKDKGIEARMVDHAFNKVLCTCRSCMRRPRPSLAMADRLHEWGVSDDTFNYMHQLHHLLAYVAGAVARDSVVPSEVPVRLRPMFLRDVGDEAHRAYTQRQPIRKPEYHPWFLRVLPWFERKQRGRIHARLLDVAVALATAGLPPYCLLWITDWAYPGPLRPCERIALLEGVRNSRWELRGSDE